jgi:hypothetical protein
MSTVFQARVSIHDVFGLLLSGLRLRLALRLYSLKPDPVIASLLSAIAAQRAFESEHSRHQIENMRPARSKLSRRAL